MTRTLFNEGWEWRRADATEWQNVNLPHDAMFHEPRGPEADGGSHTGWFPGGRYIYRKILHLDDVADRVSLFFEGVYRKSRVFVNSVDAGGCLGGYTEFEVRIDEYLRSGEDNTIEVHVDNSEQPNSRWYTGSGIYRHVWLLEQQGTRIQPGGIHLVPRWDGDHAIVAIRVELDNEEQETVAIRARLNRPDSHGEATIVTDGAAAELRIALPNAAAWSADDPALYDAQVELSAGGRVLDAIDFRAGLRTIEVDATEGLRINGIPTVLRGACVHHDSGILGAATFRAAEFRRARILKEQGFNAIRSAHNPISRDLLDACDELGLYVMDESWDMWFRTKTPHDAASHYEETWQADLNAMVRRDRIHPSIVMYSIGNEVAESGLAEGIEAARRMVAHIKRIDDTVPVTAGINLMLNMMAQRGKNMFEGHEKANRDHREGRKSRRSPLGSTAFNYLVSKMGALMSKAASLSAADKASRGVFDVLDIAGYNYAQARYRKDGKLHPGRIIVGAETMPFHIAENWRLVKELPYLIGDFMWTGWDYLGEAGIGTWTYGTESGSFAKPYPYVTAGPGAIDLTGLPGAAMALAAAVWDQSTDPVIAVRPLDRDLARTHRAAWRGTDAVASWAWDAKPGTKAEIEVYSAADEVELFLNSCSLGVRKAGSATGYVAKFTTRWEPGIVEAVARTDATEVGRSTLSSHVGPVALQLRVEEAALMADGQDLAHIWIEAVDAQGTVAMLSGDEVVVSVAGPGTLAALGSADPAPTGSYTHNSTSMYRGRALAIVRANTEPGVVTVTASSTRGDATTTLKIKEN